MELQMLESIRDPLVVMEQALQKTKRKYHVKSRIRHMKWATVYEATTTDAADTPMTQQQPQPQLQRNRFCIKKFDTIVARDEYFARHILREIRLLMHFKLHPNVVHLEDVLWVKGKDEILLLITELLDLTLEDIFRSNHLLVEAQMTCIVYQILFGLSYIHKAEVVHRDLSPSNILLNHKCDVKIANFGYARSTGGGHFSEYVCTRSYRAPELVLDSPNYTTKVDMWACGCILAQMFNKKEGPKGGPYLPLFAGRTQPQQLERIISVCGTPSEADIEEVGFGESRDYLRRHHRGLSPTDLGKTLHFPMAHDRSSCSGDDKTSSESRASMPICRPALRLIERMLQFNPNKRCTADQAMKCQWLAAHFAQVDVEIEPNLFVNSDESFPQQKLHDMVGKVRAELQRCQQQQDQKKLPP